MILCIALTGARFSAKSRSLEHKSSAPSVHRIPREAHVNPYEMQFSYVIHKAPPEESSMLIPREEALAEKEMMRHELLGLAVRWWVVSQGKLRV